MAISVNWATKVIYVPQDYLSDLGGGRYGLDVDGFRLDLKDIEDSAEGIAFLDTHRHNTEVVLSGVIYARVFEIINGYTVEFENGNYTVVCSGANHNLADVKVVNSVSLVIGNAAGLISVVSGSGVTEQDKEDIAGLIESQTGQPLKSTLDGVDIVLSEMDGVLQDTAAKMQFVFDVDAGRWQIVDNQMIFYKGDNVIEIARFNLLDAYGQPSESEIRQRIRV